MRKLNIKELGRMSVDTFKRKDKYPICVVLNNVRSRHNIGAVFRTSDAFLVEKIFLCGITPCPPHREIHKTALGATESVAWEYQQKTLNTIKLLKSSGYKIIVVEQVDNPTLLQNFKVPTDEKLAFVFGNEVFGVDDAVVKTADIGLEIPQFGTKHSLNISVSVGIVLWAYVGGRL